MNIKNLIRILCTPSCWMRNHPTSKALSDFINKSLDDNCEIQFIEDSSKALLNRKIIWIRNYPYSFGSLCGQRELIVSLPDRSTVFRLYDAIERELLK